jgi:hypothetical protein
VRRFVGINACVLDKNFARGRVTPRILISGQRSRKLGPIHASIDVSSASNLKLLESLDRPDPTNDFFRNLARSFPQFLRQVECQWKRIFPKLNLRRLLDHDFFYVQTIAAPQKFAHVLGQPAF